MIYLLLTPKLFGSAITAAIHSGVLHHKVTPDMVCAYVSMYMCVCVCVCGCMYVDLCVRACICACERVSMHGTPPPVGC